MSTFSNSFRAKTFDRNVMSFFLRRNAEISGNFPGNLLAGCGNSFRKLSSSTPEILAYPKRRASRGERGGEATVGALCARLRPVPLRRRAAADGEGGGAQRHPRGSRSADGRPAGGKVGGPHLWASARAMRVACERRIGAPKGRQPLRASVR